MSDGKMSSRSRGGGARALDQDEYERLYEESIRDPNAFFSRMAREHLDWFADDWAPHTADLPAGNVRWFDGGTLNACYNCLDRHLAARGDQVAIIWEGDDPAKTHAYLCRGPRSRSADSRTH